MIGRYFGRRPTLAHRWHATPRGFGGILSWEILKMHTLRETFTLILGAKSRAFRTDCYQLTGNKVTMNWSVDCFYCFISS